MNTCFLNTFHTHTFMKTSVSQVATRVNVNTGQRLLIDLFDNIKQWTSTDLTSTDRKYGRHVL